MPISSECPHGHVPRFERVIRNPRISGHGWGQGGGGGEESVSAKSSAPGPHPARPGSRLGNTARPSPFKAELSTFSLTAVTLGEETNTNASNNYMISNIEGISGPFLFNSFKRLPYRIYNQLLSMLGLIINLLKYPKVC